MCGDRHVIVMVTVTEETPYLSGLLAGVTAMTLMTLMFLLCPLYRACVGAPDEQRTPYGPNRATARSPAG